VNSKTFIAPFAKVERAKAQINDLNTAIESFFETTPYEVISESYLERDEEARRFQLTRKLPHDINVRVGEILHNLRSSLDQMLAEIVQRTADRTETKVEFPFGRSVDEFETALRKQKKLPTDAAALIRALKPYRGGDPLLWLLHSANRKDKHRMGLVPVNLRTEGFCSYLSVWYGAALVVGSKSGQHLENTKRFTDADYVRLAVKGSPWGMYGLCRLDPKLGIPTAPDPGHRIKFENIGGTPEETMEFLTATLGTKFKTDFRPAFDVAFSDFGGLEREPVAHVLSNLRDLVERILLAFETRFFL
jgi:hypothetical protein